MRRTWGLHLNEFGSFVYIMWCCYGRLTITTWCPSLLCTSFPKLQRFAFYFIHKKGRQDWICNALCSLLTQRKPIIQTYYATQEFSSWMLCCFVSLQNFSPSKTYEIFVFVVPLIRGRRLCHLYWRWSLVRCHIDCIERVVWLLLICPCVLSMQTSSLSGKNETVKLILRW